MKKLIRVLNPSSTVSKVCVKIKNKNILKKNKIKNKKYLIKTW